MTIQQKIKEGIKDAMRSKDAVRLTVLRGLSAAFTNELVATGKTPQDELNDEGAIVVIKRLAKQRKDSIDQFEKGGRADLAESEKAELIILEEFMPTQMPEEEVRKIAESKIAEMGADKSKMGMIIGAVIKETKGQADGAVVKSVIESLLK